MCCRYWTEESPELRVIVEEMNRSSLVRKWHNITAVKSYGEIRPTDVVPVIAPDKSGRRAVYPMKWGYTGKSLLMNARAETAGQKPTFREDWEKHRCIVPASWYFEWEHRLGNDGKKYTGDKYMIQPKGSAMTWLCGLYRIENGLPVFVILTREPGDEIRFIHDRMPMIMPEELVNTWIRPDVKPEELLPYALTEMVFERAE
ncbi:MAG: SOS response-associated peptidase family protein [Eubacterium sp.]|nr:SOS response-associated peptidase family protein [Eubacterium sp.]